MVKFGTETTLVNLTIDLLFGVSMTIQALLATLGKSSTLTSPTSPSEDEVEITLTADQEIAKKKILAFFAERDSHIFVLRGYAGTGKTTLVKEILKQLPKIDQLAKMVNPEYVPREVALCATTHKASEALSNATNHEVNTVHSHMSLQVRMNYETGKNYIARKYGADLVENQIIFIDEASYIDDTLLTMIMNSVRDCKIVFMGDPTQLTPVGSTVTPVFERGFPEAELRQVVRQDDGNPIKTVCAGLRDFIEGKAKFPRIPIDGTYIKRVPRADFDAIVLQEFTDKDWQTADSKMLAWTNSRVTMYNNALRKKATGRPELHVGDVVVNNHYVKVGKQSIKTDATVIVTSIEQGHQYGYAGKMIDTDRCNNLFLPDSMEARERALLKHKGNAAAMRAIKETWCDLRPAYCCTVNKSQGSTYDRAFIDFDDIFKNDDMNQVARMLYVSISRARHSVTITGNM